MPLELYQSKRLDLLVVRYGPADTIADGTNSLKTYIRDIEGGGPATIVVDCTDAIVSDLSYIKVANEATQKMPHFATIPGCQKMALVARSDVQFGFLRMYEVVVCEALHFDTRAFSEDIPALEFAGVGHATINSLIEEIKRENDG